MKSIKNETIVDRLRKFLKIENSNLTALEKKCGITVGHLRAAYVGNIDE